MTDTRLSLIARAAIAHDGLILLAKHREYDNTFLPGGHVEPGESCITALHRELAEELGVGCVAGRYLGAIEHRWWDEEVEIWQHELNHYFEIQSPDLTLGVSPQAVEPHLEFFWSPVSEFESHNLRPEPLRGLIADWLEGNNGIWWGSTL